MRYVRFACAFLPAGTSVCMTACGDELSFEEGVDCFSKRYGGRPVISYDKIYVR